MIVSLQESYDYIIIDLPPLGPVAEVRSTSNVVDYYVYVVQWGRTQLGAVRRQLLAAPEIHERLLGGVLNKVDLKSIRHYEQIDAGYYQRDPR
jgi:Mrp family chromosome partitioning ATPase